MTKKIQDVSSTVARIIDTTPATAQRMDPDEVAKALGAEPAPAKLPNSLAAITLYAVRLELFRRLQAHGGRSGREENNLRPRIALSEQDWHKLEALAAQLAASTGLAPSPGQVGSVLLSLALRSVTADDNEQGGKEGTAVLVNELVVRGMP